MGEIARRMNMKPSRDDEVVQAMDWGGVSLHPQRAKTRLSMRGAPAMCAMAAQAIGLSVPAPLRASSAHQRHMLWQGPDDYLILAEADERQSLFALLLAALEGQGFSLVDISHRDVGFILKGEAVETLLASAIMLDLAERAFPIGMTTRTLFGKADVTLWRQASDLFYLETGRSFVPYVVALLKEGARGM